MALPAQAQDGGDLLARINALRAQHGLPGYSINGALTIAAQQQAQWIVDTGTIAHTHPDGQDTWVMRHGELTCYLGDGRK